MTDLVLQGLFFFEDFHGYFMDDSLNEGNRILKGVEMLKLCMDIFIDGSKIVLGGLQVGQFL